MDSSLTVTKVPALEIKNSYILVQGLDARSKKQYLNSLFLNNLKDIDIKPVTLEEEINNIKAVLKYKFKL